MCILDCWSHYKGMNKQIQSLTKFSTNMVLHDIGFFSYYIVFLIKFNMICLLFTFSQEYSLDEK